jgi:hypothetical protein
MGFGSVLDENSNDIVYYFICLGCRTAIDNTGLKLFVSLVSQDWEDTQWMHAGCLLPVASVSCKGRAFPIIK